MSVEIENMKFSEPDAEGVSRSDLIIAGSRTGTMAYRRYKFGALTGIELESEQTPKDHTFKEGDKIKVWSKSGTIREGELLRFLINSEYSPEWGYKALVKFPGNKGNVRIEIENIEPANVIDEVIRGLHGGDPIVKRKVTKYTEEQLAKTCTHIIEKLVDAGGYPVDVRMMTANFDYGSRLLVEAGVRRLLKEGKIVHVSRRGYVLTKAGKKEAAK